jgi:hypothetical protein
LHQIRLAYFVPRDRAPAALYEQKIRVVMRVVAEVYLQDLQSKGYRGRGLAFESKDGQPVIIPVRGEQAAAYYNNAPAYDAAEQCRRLLPEIRERVGNPQHQVIVVLAETYDEGPADHLWPGVIAQGAYYGATGGLAVFSSHLLRDEFCAPTLEQQRRLFFDSTPVPGRRVWGQPMNSPRYSFIAAGTGAIAHELGHALGLPHDHREDSRYIMGNGFRNLQRNFDPQSPNRVGFSDENAAILLSSRYLATDLDHRDDQPPRIHDLNAVRGPTGWAVSLAVSDNLGLRAIVFFDEAVDSIIGGSRLTGKSHVIQQNLPVTLRPNQGAKGVGLRVLVTDDGGNLARKSSA